MFKLKIFLLISILFFFSFSFLLPVYSKENKNNKKTPNPKVTQSPKEEKKVSAENYFETGESFYISKNYQMAVEPFQTAIGFYPNYLKAHERLVDCLVIRLNSFEDAVKFYQKKIDASYFPASDDRSGLYFGMGLCYLKSKTPDSRAKATEFFNKSLKINNTNKCALRIVEIAKKENLKYVKRPPTTLIQDYKKIFFTYVLPLIVLIVIFNIYKFIKSFFPDFNGSIFIYNMQGDKIIDELLRKFKKSTLNSISIGSDSYKNGIVIPGINPVHATLKSEKFLRQLRAKLIPNKDGLVFLFLKQKNNKGNETGATFTVPFDGGYLYDKDIIKIGDYFMQYVDPNVAKRPQEDVYDRMPALRPMEEDDSPAEVKPPETISVYKGKNASEVKENNEFPGMSESIIAGSNIAIKIPHKEISIKAEEPSQKTNGYVPAMFRQSMESNSTISVADEDEEIAIDINGEKEDINVPVKKSNSKPGSEEIIPELLLFMDDDSAREEKPAVIDRGENKKPAVGSSEDESPVFIGITEDEPPPFIGITEDEKPAVVARTVSKKPAVIKKTENENTEISETSEVKSVKKKVKKLVKKKVDVKKEPLKATLPVKKEVKEVKEEVKEEDDESGLGFWGFTEEES